MNLCNKINEIENKEFSKLTAEELLTWNYYNTYREANLYYELMLACVDSNMKELALIYANKGKLAATKAITLNSKILLIHAENNTSELQATLNRDCQVLHRNVDDATRTLNYSTDFGNVIGHISPPKIETDNLQAIKVKLESVGLSIDKTADPKKQINTSLKILDRLLLTGQISQKVYNQKCREVMLKKPKSA